MSMTDPLGDMITRIRNAQLARKSTTLCPASKLRGWVLDVLTREGYIRGYERSECGRRPPHKQTTFLSSSFEFSPTFYRMS